MTILRLIRLFPLLLVSTFAIACGSGSSPTRQVPVGPTAPSAGPSGSGSVPVTLTAPLPISPVNGDQLATLRPTLTVQNGTSSSQSGTRTYEFQVSDRTDFSLGASLSHVVPRRRQPDGRARRRRPHVVYGAIGSAADDADVLARAGRAGNDELRLDLTCDVPHEAGRL